MKNKLKIDFREIQFLLKFLKTITKEYPTQTLTIIVLTLGAAVFEAFGLSILVPLVESLNVGAASGYSEKARSLFNFFNISYSIGTILLFFFSIQLTRIFLQFLQQNYIFLQESKVSSDLTLKLYNAIGSAPWSFFKKTKSGYLINTITKETQQAGVLFFSSAEFISQFTIVLTYILFAIILSPLFTISFISVFIGTNILLKPLFQKTYKHGNATVDNRKLLQSSANEFFANIKLIHTMNLSHWVKKKYKKNILSIREHTYKMNRGIPFTKIIFEPLAIGTLCLILFTSVTHFNILISELAVLMLIFLRVTPQITQLQAKLHATLSLIPSYFTIIDLLSTCPKDDPSSSKLPINELKQSIEFKKVCFHHDKKNVLNDINLKIFPKETIAIIGPSGSGKTTIVDLITGLHTPQSGEITIDGTDLKSIDLSSWRTILGYVGQETQLFHTTIKENLVFDNKNISDQEIWASLETANAASFIKNFPNGLNTIIGDQGMCLSGGQRQRISLARTLLKRPKVLILDEITSALDQDSEKEILNTIQQLSRKIAIIIISHRMTTIQNADKVYELKTGSILNIRKTIPSKKLIQKNNILKNFSAQW